ncbi:MAG TPA: alkaline phosphatase, partial [Candidatus Limnocylindria bacterium]
MRIGPRLILFTAVAIVAVVALVVWWNGRDEGSLAIPSVLPNASAGPATLLAVGDVASCDTGADEAVADLASRLRGTIALLGDTVYDEGTAAEYRNCFDPAWGPMRPRIRPAVGNHEYETDGASGYFDYFGAAAGERSEGWYSYDLGAWHVVVLNSICELVDCSADSPQLMWLRADLAAHP